jgi:hypothetical protein
MESTINLKSIYCVDICDSINIECMESVYYFKTHAEISGQLCSEQEDWSGAVW